MSPAVCPVVARPAVAGPAAPPRGSFVLAASVLVSLLAASSAPTPLYPLYQDRWDLSALAITLVFSAYSLALLVTLLSVGSLSDHLGRRPVLLAALTAEVAAMLMLAGADGLELLIAARILQGAATGAATGAAGAALLDVAPPRRPGRAALANSIAPVVGMAVGVLGSTVLVVCAPRPTVTVYLLFAVIFTAQGVAVGLMTETGERRSGALSSLWPRIALPASAWTTLWTVGSGVVAVWALGGLYSSLGPAIVRLVAPGAPVAAGGLVFFTVAAVAAVSVWTFRLTAPIVTVNVGIGAIPVSAVLSLSALHGAGVTALFGGAALAGIAFGAVSQGAVRLLLAPLGERGRAAAVAAYYILSYLAMSLPVIAAGAAAGSHGLRATVHGYAAGAVILTVTAASALCVARRHRALTTHTSKDTANHAHSEQHPLMDSRRRRRAPHR